MLIGAICAGSVVGAMLLAAHFDKVGRAVWFAVAVVLFITAVFVCGFLLMAGAISFQ